MNVVHLIYPLHVIDWCGWMVRRLHGLITVALSVKVPGFPPLTISACACMCRVALVGSRCDPGCSKRMTDNMLSQSWGNAHQQDEGDVTQDSVKRFFFQTMTVFLVLVKSTLNCLPPAHHINTDRMEHLTWGRYSWEICGRCRCYFSGIPAVGTVASWADWY